MIERILHYSLYMFCAAAAGAQQTASLFETCAEIAGRQPRHILTPRTAEMREEFDRRHPEQSRAVQAGLAWLGAQQRPDGSFSDEPGTTIETTASVLLAFLVAGHGPKEGPYATVVGPGLSWLVAQQSADGWIRMPSESVSEQSAVRQHSVACYVLVDAALFVSSRRLHEVSLAALEALAGADIEDPWREVALAYGVRAELCEYRPRTREGPAAAAPAAAAGAIFAAHLRAVNDAARPRTPEDVVEASLRLVDSDTEDPGLVFLSLMGLRQIGGKAWYRCGRPVSAWIRAQRPDGSWAPAGQVGGSSRATAARVLGLEHEFVCLRFFRR